MCFKNYIVGFKLKSFWYLQSLILLLRAIFTFFCCWKDSSISSLATLTEVKAVTKDNSENLEVFLEVFFACNWNQKCRMKRWERRF